MCAFAFHSAPDRRIIRIEINRIRPNPHQPRKQFNPADLRALADSIDRYGLLSPLLVRRCGPEFELIAGERRLRALEMLGCSHADVIVTSAFDRDCALMGLIENLQREDLHFLDEAAACRRILHAYSLTQEELAASLCKSPSALANLLRLLRLDPKVQECIRGSSLSERHARCLLRIPEPKAQLELAQQSIRQHLSVRQLESLVDQAAAPSKPKNPAAPLMRDHRLVINALRSTVRQLKRIGVPASSRVETHEDHYDVIVTIQIPAEA